jgi:putative transcriptional regulator
MNTQKEKHLQALEASLREVIDHEKGKITLKTTTLPLPKRAPEFKSNDIINIRKKINVSQAIFAGILNISKETEAKWEQGKRNPNGSALRLLEIIRNKPELVLSSL